MHKILFEVLNSQQKITRMDFRSSWDEIFMDYEPDANELFVKVQKAETSEKE